MVEKIGAVILTMNRKEMVTECIDSLINLKLDKIVVVDNGSKDETTSFLRKKYKREVEKNHLVIVSLKKNIGSAGGYNEGIKKSAKLGINWVWLFDDDCEALPGSLENLLAMKNFLEKKEKVGFIASKIDWMGGGTMPIKIDFKNKQWSGYIDKSLIRVRWSVYTGLFVNMDAVRSNGLPLKELFLYEDDTEFSNRLTENFQGFYYGKCKIFHKDKISNRKKYLSFDSKNFSRYRYALRNGVYFARVLSRKDKKEGFLHFSSILKNILISTLFSKRFYYFPILFLWMLKGFFLNPKIEKI